MVSKKALGFFLLSAEHAVFDSLSKEEHGKNSNWHLLLCIPAHYTHSKEQEANMLYHLVPLI